MPQILIAEDNPEIAALLVLHLRDLSHSATVVSDGESALKMSEVNHYDLLILDLMLPVLDGLSVCKALRARAGYLPIIMLTSKSSELDRVLGLEMGADDYLSKPFSIPELMARVKAQLRRQQVLSHDVEATPQTLSFGEMQIEPEKRRVTLGEKSVTLTAKEYDLLHHFVRRPGRVFSRAELLSEVWGYSYEGYEHTVNSHINRLRAKIEQDPLQPRYILTVWGVGYKFNDEVV